MSIPKFEMRQDSSGRWFVETDWHVPATPTSRMVMQLQVTSGGRLDTRSRGWATKEKAKEAIEQCKRRLR